MLIARKLTIAITSLLMFCEVPLEGADCLGVVKMSDVASIPAFVDVLLGNTTCLEDVCAADLNEDGTADGADVGPLVDCILLGSCQPQPAMWINEVMPFDWADGPGDFRFFNSMNGTQGAIGGGNPPHSSSVGNGELHLTATTNQMGTSFAGRFLSLRGKDIEASLTVTLSDPMPSQIHAPFRVMVESIRVRVRGSGRYRLEVKNGTGMILWNVEDTIASTEFVDRFFPLPGALPGSKLLNVIAESTPIPADIFIDRIDLVTSVPQALIDDPLLYGALTSYCQLLRALDGDGFTRDRNTAGEGEFNSVPAMGFQILGAAIAEDLGLISLVDAQAIAEASAAALLTVPIETTLGSGLLPHFMGHSTPTGEYSSVDTALTCIAAIEGLCALGMTARRDDIYTQIVDQLDFAPITINGEISHGVTLGGDLITNTWDRWGGELTVVEMLRAMRDPTLDPPAADRTLEHFGGVGFIVELAALFAPEFGMPGFGVDQHGIDWNVRRQAHLADQKSFVDHALFGLSASEIIQYLDSSVDYLAAGIGKTNPPTAPMVTRPGFGPGPWISPHYMSMTASLEPLAAESRIDLMRDTLRLWGPLNGPPESVELTEDGCIGMWHRLQVTLNSAFNLIGLYHAIRVRDGGTDIVYSAVDCDPRLRMAVDAVFLGPLPDPPTPIRLEGELGTGPGPNMSRSNASGGLTRWLHAGESLDLGFTYPATIAGNYSVAIRYSNDNSNSQPNELVTVKLDNNPIGSFTALDTGDGGFGWNTFEEFGLPGEFTLVPGVHSITVSPSGGDGFGVEVDFVELTLN